jgi:hypothetical protein
MKPPRLRPANRLLAQDIVSVTRTLVTSALDGNWEEVSGLALHRRTLLGQLEEAGDADEQACIIALRQAIDESDTAFAALRPGRLH